MIGTQTWRRADLGSKHMLLKEGIGWGNMPEPMVRGDLEGGRLVQLDLPESKDRFFYRLHAIYRTDTPPGRQGPGSTPGSRLRRQRRPKPPVNAPSLPHRALGAKTGKREMSGGAVRSVARFSATTSGDPSVSG